MPKICYVPRTFQSGAVGVIEQANTILTQYDQQGFVLTLRQLYYQFVARGLIPNRDAEYKRLGGIVNDARLAGLIDWDYLEDRTRNLKANPHWESPEQIVLSCAEQFEIDKWREQPVHAEVWIEKDALIGVIENVCQTRDVPYFSCRGYTSQSEMWRAAMRLKAHERRGQETIVIHLGDHDPSGVQMTEDIQRRLDVFGSTAQVNRIALTMEQIRQYDPPPNPAKLTDSRAADYVARYGDDSWELDALEPNVIVALVQDAIDEVRDLDVWDESVEEETKARGLLTRIVEKWNDVATFVQES